MGSRGTGPASSASAGLLAALAMQCAQQQALAIQTTANQLLQLSKSLPPGFPPGPPYDLALEMGATPLQCMDKLKAKFGGAVGFKLASRPVVLVSSPDLVKEVLVMQSSIFLKAGTAFFPGNTLVGNGLLVSDGETWKRQRRLSNPAFRSAAIGTYRQAIISQANKMVKESWKVGGSRDVYCDFNKLTMNIVRATLFGSFAEKEDMDEIGSAITTAFSFFLQRSTSILMLPDWVPTPENLQYHIAVARLDDIVYNMIAKRKTELRQASNQYPALHQESLLTRLLQATDIDGSVMDDQSLRDELMTFLVAGQETSAVLLTWCLVMLALHPEIQEQLSAEVQTSLGSQGPTLENSHNLRYTEAFILETMRLYPPAYMVGRCASQRTSLGPWQIPAGTTILVSLYLLHRDPLYWKRALEFKPSRWLQEARAREQLNMDCYWPFGGGPRKCIGEGFVMMEVSLVLYIIMQRWKICLPLGGLEPKPQPLLTLRPESPLYLELIPR